MAIAPQGDVGTSQPRSNSDGRSYPTPFRRPTFRLDRADQPVTCPGVKLVVRGQTVDLSQPVLMGTASDVAEAVELVGQGATFIDVVAGEETDRVIQEIREACPGAVVLSFCDLHVALTRDMQVTERVGRTRLVDLSGSGGLVETLAAVGSLIQSDDPSGIVLRVNHVGAVADYLAVAAVLAGRADLDPEAQLAIELRREPVSPPGGL